jgi:polyisoprenoid-binding protein YceI
MKSRLRRCFFFIVAGLLVSSYVFGADGPCIVPGRGHFQIHVGTTGLFGAFAHSHLIQAEKIMGCAKIDSSDLTRSSIKLDFPTPAIRVIDPKESDKDRGQVQKTMETDVLRISEFPMVTFESTAIERVEGADRFRVRGTLTIRGKSQPATIPITLTRVADGNYRAVGEYKFKQTSFGIKPIQLAGGTVKVKDELQVEFELFLQ